MALFDQINATTEKSKGLVFTKPAQKQIHDNSKTYLISFIESLKKKPESDDNASKKQKVDPFENPEADLVILKEDHYSLVLNKFPIIKNHFLLITNEFVPQEKLLEPQDLVKIHTLLTQLGKTKRRSGLPLAFYNSGPESGASQPHKHVQFVFIDDSEEDFPVFMNDIVGRQQLFLPDFDHPPLQDASRKHSHFILPLNSSEAISEEMFGMLYMSLIQQCLTVMKDHHNMDNLPSPNSTSLSYNLLMTEMAIMLVPRSRGFVEHSLGTFSINSLGYVGMILVKDKMVFEKIETGDVDEVLLKGGFIREYERGDKEGDY